LSVPCSTTGAAFSCEKESPNYCLWMLRTDGNHFSGHVGGQVAGEEHNHVRYLQWVGRSAEYFLFHQRVDEGVAARLGEVRMQGEAGGDGVDAHVVGG